MITRCAAPALLPLLFAVSVAAQQLPPAPGAHVITVTAEAGYFNEPSIAVNPRNPRQVVAAYQVPAHIAYSEDSDVGGHLVGGEDRKSTRLNSSHPSISYAVFCL